MEPRPQLVVDDHGVAVTGSSNIAVLDSDRVGIPGPFGRERVVSALPTNKGPGPVLLQPARVLHDDKLCYLADPDGNLIGVPPVIVHRMLTASRVADTRRL